MVKKKNCWEVKKCGREPGGKHVRSLGTCRAASDSRLDGIHGGKYAGRACWVIAGTLCGGAVQGSFAQKYATCEECEFYKSVRAEEGGRYKYSNVLVQQIKHVSAKDAHKRTKK